MINGVFLKKHPRRREKIKNPGMICCHDTPTVLKIMKSHRLSVISKKFLQHPIYTSNKQVKYIKLFNITQNSTKVLTNAGISHILDPLNRILINVRIFVISQYFHYQKFKKGCDF